MGNASAEPNAPSGNAVVVVSSGSTSAQSGNFDTALGALREASSAESGTACSSSEKRCITNGEANAKPDASFRERLNKYVVDNTNLRATTIGLSYRLNKNFGDKLDREFAVWGTSVMGADCGDGWLQVDCFGADGSDRYLPMVVNDIPVMLQHVSDNDGDLAENENSDADWDGDLAESPQRSPRPKIVPMLNLTSLTTPAYSNAAGQNSSHWAPRVRGKESEQCGAHETKVTTLETGALSASMFSPPGSATRGFSDRQDSPKSNKSQRDVVVAKRFDLKGVNVPLGRLPDGPGLSLQKSCMSKRSCDICEDEEPDMSEELKDCKPHFWQEVFVMGVNPRFQAEMRHQKSANSSRTHMDM